MLYRVIGRAGSGKTEYIKTRIGETIESCKQCVIIVPVQQSMEYEKDIFTQFGSKANLYAEVLTFDRLPNRTYREYGGLAATYADEGGRTLLMAHAVDNVKDKLEEFSAVSGENAFIEKMIDTSRLLKENGIDVKTLGEITSKGKIGKKSRETQFILSEYDSLFNNDLLDSRDSLTVYAEKLRTMPFFKGKSVFIDSFNSFTEQQLRVIDEIANQAEDIFISLCYDDSGNEDGNMFENPGITYRRLEKYNKFHRDVVMPESKRFSKESLAYIEENLWNSSAAESSFGDDGGIEFIKCKSVFDEAEAAAYSVIKLVESGCKYKDIVIISRSPENYFGILDVILEKHNIPCYFAAKESLLIKPLCVFLLSALEAVAGGFALPVMKKIIKSGFLPITEKQTQLIVRYGDTWNIYGKRWIGDSDWLMNPDGYRVNFDKYEEYTLKEVNTARNIVAGVLSSFNDEIKECKTYEDFAKAVYSLLESVNASENIVKKAEKLRACGDDDSAQKLTELWDIVINSIDQMYIVGGKREVSLSDFLKRLELIFSVYSLGSVPEYCDSVIIGGASVFRGNNPKAVILFGVNDGEFPASPKLNGVFDNREIGTLAEKGICLEESLETQQNNERLFFYTSATTASEKLVCIYNEGGDAKPSVGERRLEKLFCNAKKISFGEDEDTLVFSPCSAREHSARADGTTEKMLLNYGLDDIKTIREYPLSDKNAAIKSVVSGAMSVSPSRLEKYSCCGFSYFGKYVLKLTKNKKAVFDTDEIGLFVHKMLEIFVSESIKDGKFVCFSDDEISKKTDELTENYITSLCLGGFDSSKRFAYTLSRLKKTLFMLFKNISEELSSSNFLPIGFEVPLDEKSKVYTTEKGMKIRLNGIIDRIDTYKKNGKTYVRITDYKTGKKEFDKKILDYGLDMQMLLYLFSYCSGRKDTLPAGVTYKPSKLESERKDINISDIEKEKEISKKFTGTGLVLDEVWDDWEINPEKKHTPKKCIISAAELGLLREKTEKYIKKVASLIADGNMNVSPLFIHSKYDACKNCDMKSVCRLSTDISLRRQTGLTGEEE